MEWGNLATPRFSSHLVGGSRVSATIVRILPSVHAQDAVRRTGLGKPHLFTTGTARFYICKFTLARYACINAWIMFQFGGNPGKRWFYAIDC